ncbi:hypothetical protein LINGRAHAP2_LOCUS31465 [Linum grandiflorum]
MNYKEDDGISDLFIPDTSSPCFFLCVIGTYCVTLAIGNGRRRRKKCSHHENSEEVFSPRISVLNTQVIVNKGDHFGFKDSCFKEIQRF